MPIPQIPREFAGFFEKYTPKRKIFPKKFGGFKNSPYLCTRLTEKPASVAQLVRAPDC